MTEASTAPPSAHSQRGPAPREGGAGGAGGGPGGAGGPGRPGGVAYGFWYGYAGIAVEVGSCEYGCCGWAPGIDMGEI
ncbi:hypothetical protein GCM10009863_15990 [Streptomyces axinellae]|uniref:Uncharacterized protein n=1 Tax=Streptomyces axinellae TaxID=552788 RepID=A0ABN3PZ79_9ACTN